MPVVSEHSDKSLGSKSTNLVGVMGQTGCVLVVKLNWVITVKTATKYTRQGAQKDSKTQQSTKVWLNKMLELYF